MFQTSVTWVSLCSVYFVCLFQGSDALYQHWYNRTVDCSGDGCFLEDPVYKELVLNSCRYERIPHTLNNKSKDQPGFVCPIRCVDSPTLSVTWKEPQIAKCANYYDYGYVKNPETRDWEMWVQKLCYESKLRLTVWCRFDFEKSTSRKDPAFLDEDFDENL